jgi:hypothetical protein
MMRSRSDLCFDVLLIGCVLLHAIAIAREPWVYVADDALFYFQIAFNVAHGHGFTFSGLTPTNGFHPFWELVCVPFGWIATKQSMLSAIVAAIAAINAVTLLALRDLFRRVGVQYPSAPTLFAAPYLFFVAIGMEAHLSALLLVLTMRACHSLDAAPTPANLARTAACAGLTVFSRLDLVLLLAPLGAWSAIRYLAAGSDRGRRLAHIGLASALAAAPVLAFLAINTAAFGDPVPISGLLKLEGAGAEPLSTRFDGIVLLYLGVALAAAAVSLAPPRDALERIHLCLTAGMLAFLAYLLFGTSEAYSWYYYSWAVIASNGVALLLRRVARRAAASQLLRHLPLAMSLLAALFGVASMLRYGRGIPQPSPFTRPESGLAAQARKASIERLYTFDRPGQLAFYYDFSVMAADGLTTNLPFQRQLAERGIAWLLDDLAIQAIVVPRLGGSYGDLCGRLFLGSLRFSCGGDGQISSIEAISRWNGRSLGHVDLSGRPRLEYSPDLELVVVLLEDGDAAPAAATR